MTHDELRELTGAYALGALNDDDRRAVEAHLPVCAACSDEVRAMIEAAHALAVAVDPADPPPDLRARVLQHVLPASAARRQEPRRTVSVVPYWVSVAASLAAVALGLYSLFLRNRIELLQEQLRNARAATSAVERQLALVRAEADEARQGTTILTAADVRRVDLAGQPPAADASGRAFWSPTRGVVLAATRLPALPAGRVYQLWMVTDTGPRSVALLTPDAQGNVSTIAQTPAGVNRVDALAITLEPAGGVPAPTGPRYLIGAL